MRLVGRSLCWKREWGRGAGGEGVGGVTRVDGGVLRALGGREECGVVGLGLG